MPFGYSGAIILHCIVVYFFKNVYRDILKTIMAHS